MRNGIDILRTPARRASARTEAGFSFVELLVAMAILTVLAGLMLTLVGKAGSTSRSFLTRQRMNKAAMAAEEVRRHFGTFAPTDPRAQSQRFALAKGLLPSRGDFPGNDTNEGGESLVLATYAPSMVYDPQFNREDEAGDFVNTDHDALRNDALRNDGLRNDALAAPAGRTQTRALLELRDEWDQPLVYIEARDYRACAKHPVMYVGRQGPLPVRPWQNDDGTFAESSSFQIFSIGPDGVPNTDDDLKHWSN